ncbi:MAG: Fic family protein [Longimicrobiales bacterium]|nr:Fic family protein [Longimicrobiales bacterium]
MKIPESPPDLFELLASLDRDRVSKAIESSKVTISGKYLHWDQIRHREPPFGLSHEEWWAGVRVARYSAREAMPFRQKNGESFSFVYAPPVREGLHRIDQSFGMSVGPSSDVEAIVEAHGTNYLLANSLMEEAIRSSQLEGASTTRDHAKEMIRERRKPRDKSERMILNNYAAVERLEEMSEEPLSVERIFELHRILVDGTFDDPTKAGVFRSDEDNVVVGLLHTVETAHVPPPPHELEERLQALVDFANDDAPDRWLHPVLKSIIVHFMIGYDHPFVDGNGRVARALFYWSMLRHGYPLAKYLSISRALHTAPAKYSRAYLYTETDAGDLTFFIDHQIRIIRQSIAALESYVERKARETQEVEAEIRARHDLNHRQIKLLSHALRKPGAQYTVHSHQTSHRVVYNTAGADLKDLAAKGLLLQSKEGRQYVFIAPNDIRERLRRRESR